MSALGAAIDLSRSQAPALLVLAPLLAAGLAALSPRPWLAAAALGLSGVAVAALGADLAWRAAAGFAFVQDFAGDRSLQATLRGDGLTGLAVLHLSAGFLVVSIAAGGLLRAAFDPAKAPLACALLAVAGAAAFAAVLAADLFTAVLALEAGALSGAALTGLAAAQDRRGAPAALHQLAAGGVGGALALLGVALVQSGAGASDVQSVIAGLSAPGAARVAAGLALLTVGAALLAGVAPFHAWAALALSRAPQPAALALFAVSAPAAFYVLVRLVGAATAAGQAGGAALVAIGAVGAVAGVLGAAQALAAGDLRRLAFHAATAQVGAAMLGLAVGGHPAATAALLTVQAGALGGLACLAGAALVGRAGRASTPLSGLDGLARRAPLAAVAYTLGALSLVGAPLTGGFTAKLLLFGAFLERGWWFAAAVAAFGSLALAVAFARALGRIWLAGADPGRAPPPLRRAAWVPLALGGFGALLLGLDARGALELAGAAATALTGIAAP